MSSLIQVLPCLVRTMQHLIILPVTGDKTNFANICQLMTMSSNLFTLLSMVRKQLWNNIFFIYIWNLLCEIWHYFYAYQQQFSHDIWYLIYQCPIKGAVIHHCCHFMTVWGMIFLKKLLWEAVVRVLVLSCMCIQNICTVNIIMSSLIQVLPCLVRTMQHLITLPVTGDKTNFANMCQLVTMSSNLFTQLSMVRKQLSSNIVSYMSWIYCVKFDTILMCISSNSPITHGIQSINAPLKEQSFIFAVTSWQLEEQFS